MNTASIIILAVVAILVGLALYVRISAVKKGKSGCEGCSGNCSNCNKER